MALQLSNYVAPTGETHRAGYARIVGLSINQDVPDADLQVSIHHTKAARDAHAAPLDKLYYNLQGAEFASHFGDAPLLANGLSPIKSGYAFLKAQGGFEAATDV